MAAGAPESAPLRDRNPFSSALPIRYCVRLFCFVVVVGVSRLRVHKSRYSIIDPLGVDGLERIVFFFGGHSMLPTRLIKEISFFLYLWLTVAIDATEQFGRTVQIPNGWVTTPNVGS